MTMDHDFERAVRGWIAEGPEQVPDPTLDLALREIAGTPQRSALPAMRAFPMLRSVLSVAAAAVVVVVAAILAISILPGNNVGPPAPRPTPTVTPAPTPTPSPIPSPRPPAETRVSGRFAGVFGSVVIEAAGVGSSVSGSMEVTVAARRQYTVDLRCSRSEPDGVLLIGGPVTE